MVGGFRVGDRQATLLVTLVAVIVALPGIGNGFAYDDFYVIANNYELHHPYTALPRAFSPYLGGQMLRPVPLLGFAGQWVLGGGSPLIFRIASLALYAIVTVLVLQLLRKAGGSPVAALAGAMVFAVHPVHSEVTANGVGQLELLTATMVLGATVWYLGARGTSGLRRRDSVVMALLFLLAVHTKEVGYVLPGLLIAAEVFVVVDRRPWHDRVAMLREPGLILIALFFGSLAIRNHVLGGMGGGVAHASLEGLGFGDRVVVFLGLIPEWYRLLLWPARLQAEYGPPALDPGGPVGASHALGLALLILAVSGVILAWRRAPMIAFGAAWVMISIAPVANLLFPTGVVLAERTLFLPSVGLALATAGAVGLIAPTLLGRPTARRLAVAFGITTLLVAGWRSAVRQPEWRDTYTVLKRSVQVAPRTSRAHLLLGREQQRMGDLAAAEASYRRAGMLWAQDSRPFEELGQLLRAQGDCAAAIPILIGGVDADSTSDLARSRLVECLIVERRWDEAEEEAGRGLAQGVAAYQNALARIRAGRFENTPK